MALIETKYGRTVLKKAESMKVVPYVYDNSVGDYVLGEDVYDISAVIGDSITIEQSEGNSEAKYNEFVGAPLLESVSGEKYVFSAQCIDLQNSVLKSLFGAKTVSSVAGAAAFNDDFVTRYVLVRIRFSEDNAPDVLLPKVNLNSRLFVNQLDTRVSQGNISGNAMPRNVAIIDKNDDDKVLQFSSGEGNTYTPFAPVLFVPHGYTPLVLYKKRPLSGDLYSEVDFENGTVTHDIVVGVSGSVDIDTGGDPSDPDEPTQND